MQHLISRRKKATVHQIDINLKDEIYFPFVPFITRQWPFVLTAMTHVLVRTAVPSLIARCMGPTWGPSGADRTQVGPMLTPWALLSGLIGICAYNHILKQCRLGMLKYFHTTASLRTWVSLLGTILIMKFIPERRIQILLGCQVCVYTYIYIYILKC